MGDIKQQLHEDSKQMLERTQNPPSDAEIQAELNKKPGDKLSPTVAGAIGANERLHAAVENAEHVGDDGDAFGMESNIVEQLGGHD
jgi:hypothetical protein